MNLATGYRLFQVRSHPRAQDFQAFLSKIRRHYRGWQVIVLLDGAGSHIANASQEWAARLGLRLLWLPKRAPELNPMDTLWGQGKDAICANKQYTSINEQVASFIDYASGLPNETALQTPGVLSEQFWRRHIMSKKFWLPAEWNFAS